jgi:hypothetical protein
VISPNVPQSALLPRLIPFYNLFGQNPSKGKGKCGGNGKGIGGGMGKGKGGGMIGKGKGGK